MFRPSCAIMNGLQEILLNLEVLTCPSFISVYYVQVVRVKQHNYLIMQAFNRKAVEFTSGLNLLQEVYS